MLGDLNEVHASFHQRRWRSYKREQPAVIAQVPTAKTRGTPSPKVRSACLNIKFPPSVLVLARVTATKGSPRYGAICQGRVAAKTTPPAHAPALT